MTFPTLPRITILVAILCSGAAQADPMMGARERGRAYAEAICADCHIVGPSNKSVVFLHSLSFEQIAADSRVTEIALRAFFQTSHATMPNFIFTRGQTDDLVAYILSLKPNPDE